MGLSLSSFEVIHCKMAVKQSNSIRDDADINLSIIGIKRRWLTSVYRWVVETELNPGVHNSQQVQQINDHQFSQREPNQINMTRKEFIVKLSTPNHLDKWVRRGLWAIVILDVHVYMKSSVLCTKRFQLRNEENTIKYVCSIGLDITFWSLENIHICCEMWLLFVIRP